MHFRAKIDTDINFGVVLSYDEVSNRWKGSHMITENDKDGEYHVSIVNAHDIYDNYKYPYFTPENQYVFITGANADSTGPDISDFILEENSQTLTVGDTIHVSAKITDDSEIKDAFVHFRANSDTDINFGIRLTYDEVSNRWKGSRVITENDKDGEYYVSIVNAHDIYDNYKYPYFTPENQVISIITGTSQSEGYFFDNSENTVQNHLIGSGFDSVFTIKRSINDELTFALFRGIQMDGEDVPQRFWKAEQGSVVITLSADYMDTLDIGNHTLTGIFEDGTLDIDFSVSKPFIVLVKFTSVRSDSSYFIPSDLKDKKLTMTITITGSGTTSAAENIELDLESLLKNRDVTIDVLFENEIKDFSNEYKVIVTNYPKKLDADIYVENGSAPQYNLKIEGAPGQIEENKFGIHIFLIWNDDADSKPEIIAVYALPEDEIGAYAIGPDGTKEYLIFQTYDICMNYLGSEELCSGNERCYHK